MVWYLDACSLLNLVSTGKLEAIAASRKLSFRLVPLVVEREAQYLYARVGNERGELEPMNLSPYFDSGTLQLDTPLEDSDLPLFLAYASLVDDGEAMTIATAELRQAGVVTDDLRAWRVLERHSPQVRKVTSLGLIKEWAESAKVDPEELVEMFDNMRIRANFVPGPRQPHFEWYEKKRTMN